MKISTGSNSSAAGGADVIFSDAPSFGPVTVRPNDPRYSELVVGRNRRWVAAPDSVHLVGTTDQVRRVVQEAIHTGKRVSVRSGGHCHADFVYNSAVELIIDFSLMNQIYYDPKRKAFAVESGAQLGRIYETLFKGWDVTIPGGVCPTVAIGGHASGGGHGLLSRQFGNVADHIEAVEMVVNRHGTAHTVIASREDSGPENDLWWASTGGGGGNFGVITRYWFRSREATGSDPSLYLPRPPKEVLISMMFVPWSGLDQTKFTNLIRNLGTWYEHNSDPSSPYAALCGLIYVQHVSSGGIGMLTQVDATVPNAVQLLNDYLTAVTAGTGVTEPFSYRRLPWMASTETIYTSNQTVMTDLTPRNAVKSAYLRRNFTDEQITAIYRNMTRTDYTNPGGSVIQLGAMAGGKINAVPPTATAVVQRSSAFLAYFQSSWADPTEDDIHLGWLRDIYREVFDDTGGYPVPGDRYEGCSINGPDLDITDPAFNQSGVPWHTFYYGENYARLQRAKAHWDPTNFFRHSLSITAP
ncbi:MAG: FAD-binding oxidoreductase [Pseudonocardiaceae bacterium]